MTIVGRERVVEVNGEQTLDQGWLLSFKRRGWCLWHHSNEAGMRVIQVGFLILEVWKHEKAVSAG